MSEQRIITLREWEKPKPVSLLAVEAAALRSLQELGRLDVTWHGPTEAAVSGSAGYVGIAALSETTQLIVRPHIPVASVLTLACFAYELEPPPDTLVEEARLDASGPADWLALLLTLEVEKLLALGLRYGYREVEEGLPYIRGRIDFGALRSGESKSGLVPCRFEDFVLDTAENRILRGTLEILAAGDLAPEIRRRLWRTLSVFRQVGFVRPTQLLFNQARLNRLNSHYEPALTLCRLVLECAGLDVESGNVTTRGFFFSMADVFEKAVERALREGFGRRNVQSQREYRDRIRLVAGEPAIPVTFKPDNVIGPPGAPWLIVDAKYKQPLIEHHGERYRNPDLYQAFTYAVALSAPAVLIYPRCNQNIDVTFEAHSNMVRVLAIDLAHDGLRQLPAQLRAGALRPADICTV
jgi:5-methylcytosine-specific restriction enzyme subunit McrC